MYRICCLKKGETAATLAKEVLYRRYLRFYLTFHVVYAIMTLTEYLIFLSKDWGGFYLASFIMLLIDSALIIGLLLRPEKGPDKRVIGIAFVMTCLTLLLYIAARLYAFFSPHTNTIYRGFLIIFLIFFIFTKSRCMYHIYRFNRFNSFNKFEKKTTNLSVKSPIGINEESWTNDNDGFDVVGVGNTNYVTMEDNDEDNKDKVSALPSSPINDINRSVRSNSTRSDGSLGSLGLGDVNISVTSNKSDEFESQHSFHAVSGQI